MSDEQPRREVTKYLQGLREKLMTMQTLVNGYKKTAKKRMQNTWSGKYGDNPTAFQEDKDRHSPYPVVKEVTLICFLVKGESSCIPLFHINRLSQGENSDSA